MRCANSEALEMYLSYKETIEKENEKYKLEFVETLSDLRKYAIKNDKLELLIDTIKNEFNLYTNKEFNLWE